MRRPRSSRAFFSIAWVAALAVFASPTAAQGGGEALFLLLPVGAQAVGMGQAVVAQRGGSEGVWWNPASLGGSTTHELALHHSQTVIGQGNALTFVEPTRRFGTIAPFINVLDLEEEAAVDDQGLPQGVIIPTNLIYGLTYAVAPASFLALGASVKHVSLRIRCSGFCANLPTGGSSSNGVDLGTQFRPVNAPVTLGLAVRNLGVGGGDMSPARVDLGADCRIPGLDRYVNDVEVHAMGGVVTTRRLDSASVRLGTDVVFEQRIHVRGGYIVDHANGSGASLGFGIAAGKLVFDLARTFGGISADGDKPPTYFSLRYLW